MTRRTLIPAVLTWSALSAALLFSFIPNQSSPDLALRIETADARAQQEQTISELPASPAGRPTRLKIPRIKVDAAVEYVGLTSDGAMDVPENPDDVAWFELGQRPGEDGNAVIAGHYGPWESGRGSVFDGLRTLKEGDKLYVEDDQGVTTTFVVRASRKYDPNADASSVFNSHDGHAHLNLITCEGVWNETQKSYSNRLVVFTDKEKE